MTSPIPEIEAVAGYQNVALALMVLIVVSVLVCDTIKRK